MTSDEWFKRLKGLMRERAYKIAVDARQWAVNNHPWENRTGEAEKHLLGYTVETDNKIGFGVGHGKGVGPDGKKISYGKYLETIQDRKYGVCEKAVKHFIPEFDQMMKRGLKVRPK